MLPRWMPAQKPPLPRRSVDRRWTPAPASRGQGTLLACRLDAGLRLIAPPGVSLARDDGTISYEGWRSAFWPVDVNGDAWIESRAPETFSVLRVDEVVRSLPPSCWKWVHERCRRQVLSLVGYVTPTATGVVPEDAEEARSRLLALVAELEMVFSREAWAAMVPELADHLQIADAVSDTVRTARAATQPAEVVRLDADDMTDATVA
jgi:hypothetical protein